MFAAPVCSLGLGPQPSFIFPFSLLQFTVLYQETYDKLQKHNPSSRAYMALERDSGHALSDLGAPRGLGVVGVVAAAGHETGEHQARRARLPA